MHGKTLRRCAVGALVGSASILIGASSVLGAPTISVSSPYLSTATSTLNPLSPTYHLEDFEDGVLNIPGVSYSVIGTSGPASGNSVDADDGVIDGSGALGNSFRSETQASANNLTFFFSQVGGQWPKQVAIALTLGSSGSLELTSYDTSFNPAGSATLGAFSLFSGSTSDHFLITFIDNAGIGAIVMQTNQAATHIYYDHLQSDTAPAELPEPASAGLISLATIGLTRRKR